MVMLGLGLLLTMGGIMKVLSPEESLHTVRLVQRLRWLYAPDQLKAYRQRLERIGSDPLLRDEECKRIRRQGWRSVVVGIALVIFELVV